MKKNKTLTRSSFFKATLFVLMSSAFSISNSYGVDKLIKKESFDSTDFNVKYSFPQVTWNRDIKNTHINITLAFDKEDLEKHKRSFLFFRFCKKPDDMWFMGKSGWKKYKEGEAPTVYDLTLSTTYSFISMNTGKPIDISSMVDFLGKKKCGELLAGYGVGTTNQEAYDEMLSKKRFDVVFDTVEGPKHKVYILEIKSISTYDFPPFVGSHICTRIRCP